MDKVEVRGSPVILPRLIHSPSISDPTWGHLAARRGEIADALRIRQFQSQLHAQVGTIMHDNISLERTRTDKNG